MITQRIRLDLIPTDTPPVIHISQYDTGKRRLEFELYKEKEIYTISDETFILQGTRSDGVSFIYEMTSRTPNIVIADVDTKLTAAAGSARAQVVMIDNGNRTGSQLFVFETQREVK